MKIDLLSKIAVVDKDSVVRSGKTKLPLKDMINLYPEGVNITAVDIITTKGDNSKTYTVFNFAEDPDKYVNGGEKFKMYVEAMLEPDENGVKPTIDDINESLSESPVKFKFKSVKTKSNRDFTDISIVK